MSIVKLYDEWKVPVAKNVIRPTIQLVSLFDLLFYYDDDKLKARFNNSPVGEFYKSKGFELNHDIIAFDEKLYAIPETDEDGIVKQNYRFIDKRFGHDEDNEEKIHFDHFAQNGFDIAVPKFDRKSKPLFLHEKNLKKYIPNAEVDDDFELTLHYLYSTTLIDPIGLTHYDKLSNSDYYNDGNTPEYGFKIWNKDAAQRPLTYKDFYEESVLTVGATAKDSWGVFIYNQEPFKVATEEDFRLMSIDKLDADIILCGEDLDFENRFLKEPVIKEIIETKVVNEEGEEIIEYETDENGEEILDDDGKPIPIPREITIKEEPRRYRAFNSICLNYMSENVWQNILKFYNSDKNIIDLLNDEDLKDEKEHIWFNNLKTFFLDENNNLNKSNIPPTLMYLIKNTYLWIKVPIFADYINYKDFDQKLNKQADVIHHNLMLTNNGNFHKYNYLYSEDLVSEVDLIKNLKPYFPTSSPSIDRIRKLLIQDIDIEESAEPKEADLQAIIDNAVDPDSKIGSVIIEPFERSNYEDIYGNPVIESFFTSRKLISQPPVWFDPDSRNSAIDYKDYPILVPKAGNLTLNGRIFSPTIDELWEMVKKLIAGRAGDNSDIVEGFEGYPRGNDESKNLKASTFRLRHHEFLEYYFDNEGKEKSIKRTGDPTFIEYDFEDSENPKYKVMNWVNDPTYIEYHVLKELKELDNLLYRINLEEEKEDFERLNNKIRSPGKPTPYNRPLSLRELEAYIKGVKWNIMYLLTFLEKSATWAGPLGRNNTDVDHNNSINKNAGTLYQLHKDYDGTHGTPNTVYDERLNNNGNEFTGKGLGNITGEMIDASGQKVPSWSVYLGADGEWHSSKQALLIPLVENELW